MNLCIVERKNTKVINQHNGKTKKVAHYNSDGGCKGGVPGGSPSPTYTPAPTTKVSWITVDKSPDMEQLLGGLEINDKSSI
jgi:hypothetical protein